MTKAPDDAPHRDEAILAPFFTAARADEPAPSQALLSAILADAGAASTARAAPAVVTRPRAHRRWRTAFDGWRIAAALVAASVFGFWVGLSGSIDVAGNVGWETAADQQGDPVAGFFDLASAE